MKTSVTKFTLALGVALIATVLTATANASCGDSKAGTTLHRQSWDGFGSFPTGLAFADF